MILIMGRPNAGKTTYSQRFENVIHLDDFPFNKFLNCNAAVAKVKGEIVVEGIYNLRCRRKKLLESYHGTEEKVCIWLNTPIEECLRREDRGRDKEVIISAFQPPTLDEGWDRIIKIDGNYSNCRFR